MDFYAVKEIVEGNEMKLMELFIKAQNCLEDSGANKKEIASFREEASASWNIIEDMLDNAKTIDDLILINKSICLSAEMLTM